MARQETDPGLTPPVFEGPTRVLIVLAPFYRSIADDLLAGARAALDAAGVTHETVEVPGALELPTAIRLASASREFDGYVALGCVVRGETTHYETVCNDSSRGISVLGLQGHCVGNGVLTVENVSQAEVRADPADQNKGGGAAEAALHLIALARRFTPKRRAFPDDGLRMAGGDPMDRV